MANAIGQGSIYNSATSTARVPMDLNGTWSGGDNLEKLINAFTSSARQYALEDRAWTAAREDTAIQRRIKDLEAAGMNPWLAVQSGLGEGAAASSSQVGKETNDAISMATSATAVLAQYASLPAKNFNQLANGIRNIVKTLIS